MSTSSCDDGLRIRKSSKIEKLSEKNSQYSLQQELMVTTETPVHNYAFDASICGRRLCFCREI